MVPSIRLILCLFTILSSLAGCEWLQNPLKPNLIIISIDTLRADHLGCYGYDRPTSPTLDKLASEGILFENAHATSPWTLPSHGTLLTGFYPGRIGLNSELSKLPSEIETLATVLSQHHFSRAAMVNSIYLSPKFGLHRGFEYFYYVQEDDTPEGAAPIIIDQAIQWLRQHKKNDQFFLFLHFFDLHSDYRSLPQYEEQFIGPYRGSIDGSTYQLLEFRKGTVSLNKADCKHLIDLYDAGIRQLDDQLAKLVCFLRQEVLLEKSFLIITSDHGEEFLDHQGVLHGRTQYEELLHIPLIIRGPGILRSKRFKEAVSLVDVVPTALSLLGIPALSTYAGVDLCPLWKKNNYQLTDRFTFSEADHNNTKDDIKKAVWHGQYKLHHNLLTGELELYNLTHDPKESLNIVSQQPTTAELLLSELKKFIKPGVKSKKTLSLTPEEIEKLKRLGYL